MEDQKQSYNDIIKEMKDSGEITSEINEPAKSIIPSNKTNNDIYDVLIGQLRIQESMNRNIRTLTFCVVSSVLLSILGAFLFLVFGR